MFFVYLRRSSTPNKKTDDFRAKFDYNHYNYRVSQEIQIVNKKSEKVEYVILLTAPFNY